MTLHHLLFYLLTITSIDCRFNAEAANVVHMTVRPQEIVDEEEASKNKALSRNGEGGESTAGCRCVIL